jgi:hypothetical protein
MSFAPDTGPFARPESLLRVPVGFASPLWGLFAGAALSGAAFWWMTRWARPENLEAAAQPVEAEPVLEALVEPEPTPESVAGESAPVSPVLQAIEPDVGEAVPKPASRPKRVPPKTDDAG